MNGLSFDSPPGVYAIVVDNGTTYQVMVPEAYLDPGLLTLSKSATTADPFTENVRRVYALSAAPGVKASFVIDDGEHDVRTVTTGIVTSITRVR